MLYISVSRGLLERFSLFVVVADCDKIGADADRTEEHRRRPRQQASQGTAVGPLLL